MRAALLFVVLFQCTPTPQSPTVNPKAVPQASTLVEAEQFDAVSREREEARDFRSALEAARQALEIREALLDPSDLRVARSQMRVAYVHWFMGDYSAVDTVVHRAFPTLEKQLSSDAVDIGRALILQSVVILHARRYDEAQPLLERAVAILEKAKDVDDDLLEAMDDLALAHHGLGHYPTSIAMFERAIAFGEQRFGPHSWKLASAIGNLAESHRMSGDPKRALPYMERAVALNEKGPYERLLASSLNNLANIHHYTFHDYAKAEPLYRRAIGISEKVYGTDDTNTAQEYLNLAGLLCAKGDWANGEPLYEKGLEIFARKLGTDHVEYVRAHDYLEVLRKKKP